MAEFSVCVQSVIVRKESVQFCVYLSKHHYAVKKYQFLCFSFP